MNIGISTFGKLLDWKWNENSKVKIGTKNKANKQMTKGYGCLGFNYVYTWLNFVWKNQGYVWFLKILSIEKNDLGKWFLYILFHHGKSRRNSNII